MDQNDFMTYLATGEAPVRAQVTVVETEKVDPIDLVVANLCAVGMLAKDLHYRARGKAFYAIHLLSDLVWQCRSNVDELLEVYYLGERKSVPPLMAYFEAAASREVGIVLGNVNCANDGCEYGEDQLLSALVRFCTATVELVERAKSQLGVQLRSGTQAVLDDISKKALQSSGLLGRTNTPPESAKT